MLEWAFTELSKNPEIYNKATKELDRVIGNERWVEEEDIIHLPFIDAIVKETPHLHGAPMLMPRMAREDCKVTGYDIRKGTQILASTWSIMRDHELRDNPNKFYPKRFLERSIDVKGNVLGELIIRFLSIQPKRLVFLDNVGHNSTTPLG